MQSAINSLNNIKIIQAKVNRNSLSNDTISEIAERMGVEILIISEPNVSRMEDPGCLTDDGKYAAIYVCARMFVNMCPYLRPGYSVGLFLPQYG